MVVQTSNPFAPAKPRVPIIPRRVTPGLPGTSGKPKTNKSHCPKCSARLSVNFEEAECLSCGYVDYEYTVQRPEQTRNSVIGTGTRYVLRYIGEFPALVEVLTHVKVYRVRNRAEFGVSCPFCGSVCLNLLCPAKEERLERSDINAPQDTEFHFVLTLKEF